MRCCVSAALAITEENANRQVNCLPRLMIGWLHIEALNFIQARQICEEVLDPAVEKNPVNFFLGRNLVAKSSLGLGDLSTAREQFREIKHRIEVDAVPMDSVFYPFFYHNLCEYFLALGDLVQARREATRLYEVARLPPERSYLALSHRLLAKIAFAGGSLELVLH
jgi:hypothetical protein